MHSVSRRRFLVQAGVATLASTWMPRLALADPLGGPIGIQLYAVREALHANPAGTLKKLKQIGFGEVETAGFGDLTAKQFRKLLDDNGLVCPSAHLAFEADKIDQSLADAKVLGASYAVTGSLRSLAADKAKPVEWKTDMGADEAKRTAELANRLGERAKRAGLQFAYHNHNQEFADLGDGTIGFDWLLSNTDPDLVKFQIDCGWMVLGGRDPVDYFKKYPNRFPSIHVKDFQPASTKPDGTTEEPRGAELGRGMIDYRPIFAAAKQAGLKHYFVEQEGPFERMDQMQAAEVAYDYLHGID